MVTYAPRIVQCFSPSPNTALLLIGEAPGPRGADRTGYPFWGDDAGLSLYELVGCLGLLDEPFTPWQRGADLSGTTPPSGRYAITNSCTQMPIGKDAKFRAPPKSRLDLEAPRLLEEIKAIRPGLVLACGKSAAYTLAQAALTESSTPPGPLARPFSRINLKQAIEALLNQDSTAPWRVGGAIALVTAHPARSHWTQSSEYRELHDAVVRTLHQAIKSRQQNPRPKTQRASHPDRTTKRQHDPR